MTLVCLITLGPQCFTVVRRKMRGKGRREKFEKIVQSENLLSTFAIEGVINRENLKNFIKLLF